MEVPEQPAPAADLAQPAPATHAATHEEAAPAQPTEVCWRARPPRLAVPSPCTQACAPLQADALAAGPPSVSLPAAWGQQGAPAAARADEDAFAQAAPPSGISNTPAAQLHEAPAALAMLPAAAVGPTKVKQSDKQDADIVHISVRACPPAEDMFKVCWCPRRPHLATCGPC